MYGIYRFRTCVGVGAVAVGNIGDITNAATDFSSPETSILCFGTLYWHHVARQGNSTGGGRHRLAHRPRQARTGCRAEQEAPRLVPFE